SPAPSPSLVPHRSPSPSLTPVSRSLPLSTSASAIASIAFPAATPSRSRAQVSAFSSSAISPASTAAMSLQAAPDSIRAQPLPLLFLSLRPQQRPPSPLHRIPHDRSSPHRRRRGRRTPRPGSPLQSP